MKDTYCKRTYKCKCKAIVEDFAWESRLKETQFMCSKCGNWVGYEHLKTKEVPQTASIRTPTKNR
jgi:hypothetical protein